MKKTIIFVAILAILGLMVVTCPTRDDHKTAITSALNGALNESYISSFGDDDSGEASIGKFLGSLLIDGVASVYINQVLDYHNYFIISTSDVKIDGKTKPLGFGILGHVFTFDKEELKENIEKAKSEEDNQQE